jgi:hypothetical protein
MGPGGRDHREIGVAMSMCRGRGKPVFMSCKAIFAPSLQGWRLTARTIRLLQQPETDRMVAECHSIPLSL